MQKFKGIGEAKAINIIAALELGRRNKSSEVLNKTKIEGSKDVTAGCRMKEAGFFADCDAVDMGSSSKQAYKNLCEAMALPRGKRRK